MLCWYIAIGEAKGGKYDFKFKDWRKPIPPEAVYAIHAEMKN